MTATREFGGGCHCGVVRYVFTTAQQPDEWPVRRCTCSYCIRLGARYTSGPDSSLAVSVQSPAVASDYEFGTGTAKFFRCNRCGVMLFASCLIDGNKYAVLNVNTLDDVELLGLAVRDADFDDEQLADRLLRRQRNWIADMTIRYGNA